MAFLPIFLLSVIEFLIIAIVIFSIIWFIGLIVTTVSAIRRGKAVRAGIKPHKAGLITGITLMALPAVIVGGFFISFLLNDTSQSGWTVSHNLRDSLQSGIETGDAQLIYEAFSEYTKSRDPKLYGEIEKILAFISEDIENVRTDTPSTFAYEHADNGSIIVERFEGRMEYIVADSQQKYRIYYFGFCRYIEDEKKLGLERVIVKCGDEEIGAGITTDPYVKG